MTETVSLRDQVKAGLSDALIEWLYEHLESQRDPDAFRDRLVHLLTRYEHYLAGTKTATRNDYRKQISTLQSKAQGLLTALDDLHPEIRQSLEGQFNELTHDTRWTGVDVFDLDQPLPDDDDSLQQATTATRRIIDACRLEIEFLEGTRGAKKGSRNPALDQLIIDLAALYETETGLAARSHCYRDETSENDYNGKFFCMVKLVLDSYAPKSYETPAALGIRILRTLTDARIHRPVG